MHSMYERTSMPPKTKLRFDPPLPKTLMHIIVGFQPARNLVVGDTVTVDLKVRSGVWAGIGQLTLQGSDSGSFEIAVGGRHVFGELE